MTSLPLLLTTEHDCSYLPGRQARSLVGAPEYPLTTTLYSRLIRHGFRRSGDMVYRPHCKHCSACLPLRVPVSDFRPNRAQLRNLRRNADLACTPRPAEFSDEHFELYARYLNWRHPGGLMADTDPAAYMDFLGATWCDTRFVEFRSHDRLAAVAVVDVVSDGLSAVYTYYEPDLAQRGLGCYAVLWQIGHARTLGLDYLYLGYWIAECKKMAYKQLYRPFETYRNGLWRASGKSQQFRLTAQISADGTEPPHSVL